MSEPFMPIARIGGCYDNCNGIATKMKRIQSQSLFQFWASPRTYDGQQFQSALYLPITTIQGEEFASFTIDNETNREVLTQQIIRNRRGNRHTIFFRGVLALTGLHLFIEVEKDPGIHRRVQIKFLHH